MTLTTVRLLEAEPDLGSFLTADERELAARVAVPVRTVGSGDVDVDALLDEAGAFAAIVLDGMLLRRVLIGEQSALRLLGPGDIIGALGSARSSLLVQGGHRASARTQLALLDEHAMLMIERFPALVIGLQRKMADQHERLATQLVICQLPRVEDRVLAMMWLLAESWGRVTTSGTILPLAMTHDALGELIGAKRPTVTLALRELGQRGALVRQDRGWLLLEPPAQGGEQLPLHSEPGLIDAEDSPWQDGRAPAPPEPIVTATLLETVQSLRRDHANHAASWAARIELAGATRERSRQIRDLIRERRAMKTAPS
ncbi:MAG TPA: Crp/Fnr family transcriptional regulator [Solirubrobacteraceae bacterium]|jgi:CRP-like cAMP-binding protein